MLSGVFKAANDALGHLPFPHNRPGRQARARFKIAVLRDYGVALNINFEPVVFGKFPPAAVCLHAMPAVLFWPAVDPAQNRAFALFILATGIWNNTSLLPLAMDSSLWLLSVVAAGSAATPSTGPVFPQKFPATMRTRVPSSSVTSGISTAFTLALGALMSPRGAFREPSKRTGRPNRRKMRFGCPKKIRTWKCSSLLTH
jgi:hypothetical protein